MTGMNRLREHPWLIAAALVVVFLAGLSMQVERRVGWGFFILCFIVGSLGGLGVMWGRDQLLLGWNRLSKVHKRIAIAAGVPLVVTGIIVADRHKPDELALDVLAVFVALFIWGTYRLTSRFFDALHKRLSKR
jgi:hypothetical protein